MASETVRPLRSDGIKSREAILLTAASLATIEGLQGLSIARLAEQVGLSKSGLYAHFGSKEELQLATVETALEIFNSEVIDPTLSITNPLERLRALCELFLNHLRRRVFPGGCFFASVGAEFDTHPGPVRARVVELQEGWMTLLATLMKEAQALGFLDPCEDPQQLAFEVDAYLLMANNGFVMNDDLVALERANTAIRTRLERAGAGVTTSN